MNILPDKYDTVFDFGCSLTMYRWITWSDLIALGVGTNRFYKTSLPGGGLRYVYQQLNHVYQNYDLSESDLILICLPTLDRKDVCNNNDYNTEYTMASWSAKGSIDFNHNPGTSMSQGHHGEPRINIIDMFMENLCYLELILKIYNNIPCDKLIIHSDKYLYDPVEYLTHDNHYLEHLTNYDTDARQQLMILAHRLRDQYSDCLATVKDIISYGDFIIRSHAEKYLDQDMQQFIYYTDPHPAPDQAYEFVKKHFLNHNHCDRIDAEIRTVMENFDLTRSRTLAHSDPQTAHLQTCDPWYASQTDYYYDSSWLFATPEQRQQGNMAEKCKTFNWPNLTMQEMINV